MHIARRQLGTTSWSIYNTTLIANSISDDHDMISMAVNGDGLLHLSWGMHNNALKYTTSTASVLNNNPIVIGSSPLHPMPSPLTSDGYANSVTYPEFYNMPDGDLLFLMRTGSSGDGNENIYRYDNASDSWSKVITPVINGIASSQNAYMNTTVVTNTGALMMSWTWRDTPAYQSNHDVCFAQSTNGGTSWTSITGAPINSGTSAITLSSPNQIVVNIPMNSSLINQTSMTVDKSNLPLVATWWAPGTPQGNYTRQYMLAYFDGSQWQSSQISNRLTEGLQSDGTVRDLGRPQVLVDQDNRVLVVTRSRGNSDSSLNNDIVVYYSTDRQNWNTLNLTPTTPMGDYEPSFDLQQWQQNGILDLFYQSIPSSSNTLVSLLEWDERAYFASIPEPSTLALLAMGVTCALIYGWRSKKSSRF